MGPDTLRKSPYIRPADELRVFLNAHADAWEEDRYERLMLTAEVNILRKRLEAAEGLRLAAQAFVDDVNKCYPEGLEALDGVRPYVEALIAALAAGEEG